MKKKFTDLHADLNHEKIDLSGELGEGKGKKNPEHLYLKKIKNVFYKQISPIKEVKDISGQEKSKYLYVKGKNFAPPKYLGNLIRIAAAGFVIIFLINAINVYFIGKRIEKDVSNTTYEGFNYLLSAGKDASQTQFTNALSSFESALKIFTDEKNRLWFINTDKSIYGKNGDATRAVNAILEGGQYFATAGKYFLEAVEEFNKIPLYFVSKNEKGSISNQTPSPSMTETIKTGLAKTDLAIKEISLAATKIKDINEKILPAQLQARVTFAKEKVAEISSMLTKTAKYFPAILKLLGDEHPHRYLILLQNNNEIRPSGGFIGSYALVDINKGAIENLTINDVYDIDNAYGPIIEPPEEFKAFTGNWRFRDSNYSSDFALSAAKARWFLEKEGGPTADTVISINQGLLKDMLDITGPVQVGNFGKLDSSNYNLLLSFVIEGKIWGAEDPKHILKVFIPAFKEAILKKENISKVMGKLYRAIEQKHIMMYCGDQDVEALFDFMGVSGKVYRNPQNEDYLSIINISTGGTKSDQFIEENISHNTNIDSNGNITDDLTIKRTHLWTDAIYVKWKKVLTSYGFNTMPDQIIDILGRGRNKVNMRIYVPNGSELIESKAATTTDKIETKFDKNLGKTYFLTTIEIHAGQSAEIHLKYKLPYKLDFSPVGTYKLTVEKQPGSVGSIFTQTITASESLHNLALYPTDSRLDKQGRISYATNLVYDKYFSGIWEK